MRTKAQQAAEPTQTTNIIISSGTAAALKQAKKCCHEENAALNMQRIGKSRWRPLELCWWSDLPELPAKGKEYPELGCKRLQDRERIKTEPEAAEPTQPTKSKGKAQPNKAHGKAAKAKPAPQPGRWLDRDCNAALNMQRIGESKWRPLELCYWPDQGALPAKGKEYPGLGYKRE
ncbi:hypothetical protein QJQ45_005641 [Haematococcus lacustris]|nr:hypothetical protein QJQ45_005641 [Haematococcus lacustris]